MVALCADAQQIVVHHSEQIDELIKAPAEQQLLGITVDVFRVQVYNGNKGSKSRTRAYEIKDEVEASSMNDVDIYVLYSAPFWKVQIGNCNTRAEAEELRKRFIDKFPDYSADAYIVPVKLQK